MHSGLFFSMPMMHRGIPVYCSTAWMPRTISSELVSISWVSLVSQTSHSDALISSVSTGHLGCSLTSVGKPAPPRPTRPLARTAARKLALSMTLGGWTAGSTVCWPSVWMTTASHALPLARRKGSTAVTVPDTLEWILAETTPAASPIRVPTHTLSPFLTTALAGAPICWLIRMRTCAGRGIGTGLLAAVALSCGVCAPSAARFSLFNMNYTIPHSALGRRAASCAGKKAPGAAAAAC